MPSFQKQYRFLFETLGYPLSSRDGIPLKVITDAEKRLNVKVPAALRDYYLVVGRERRFNQCFNRLMSPAQWTTDKQRLLFLEENQTVLWWGVSLRNPKTDDPLISQGINDEPIAWFPEHRKFSVFLSVMLHYHAVNGGFRFSEAADAPETSGYRFEKQGWTFHGEVNSLKAYSRANQVVCLMPPGDLPFMTKWTVLAGAKTKGQLDAIADEIGLTWK